MIVLCVNLTFLFLACASLHFVALFVCFPQSKSQRCFQAHFHSDSSSLSSPPSPSFRPQFPVVSSVSSSFTDTVLCSLSDSISPFLLSFARLSCRGPSSALHLYSSPHPSASHIIAAVSDLVPLLFLSIPFCISLSSHSLFLFPLFLLPILLYRWRLRLLILHIVMQPLLLLQRLPITFSFILPLNHHHRLGVCFSF